MSAADWFWLATGCTAIGLIAIALNWRHPAPPRDQLAWDRSADTAARDVAADVAETRRREIGQLEAAYQARPRPRNTIPHQTRRTEEDQ